MIINIKYEIFINNFVSPSGNYELVGYWPRPNDKDPTFIHGEVHIKINDVFSIAAQFKKLKKS